MLWSTIWKHVFIFECTFIFLIPIYLVEVSWKTLARSLELFYQSFENREIEEQQQGRALDGTIEILFRSILLLNIDPLHYQSNPLADFNL